MSDESLTSDTKALLKAARGDWSPSDDDRARYEKSLMASIGAGAVASVAVGAHTVASKSVAATVAAKVLVAAAVVAGTGVAAYKLGFERGQTVAVQQASSQRATRGTQVLAPQDERVKAMPTSLLKNAPEIVAPAPVPVAAPSTHAVANSVHAAPAQALPASSTPLDALDVATAPTSAEASKLARETELLRRARVALEGGAPNLADEWLRTYAREFSEGHFAREAELLRIRVFCALGQQTQASVVLHRAIADGNALAQSTFDRACIAR